MGEDYKEEGVTEEASIYNDDYVEELKENDEIDTFEEAFMRGYNKNIEEKPKK